jgi:hypothetical protein
MLCSPRAETACGDAQVNLREALILLLDTPKAAAAIATVGLTVGFACGTCREIRKDATNLVNAHLLLNVGAQLGVPLLLAGVGIANHAVAVPPVSPAGQLTLAAMLAICGLWRCGLDVVLDDNVVPV